MKRSSGVVVLAPRTSVSAAVITSDGRPYAAGTGYGPDGRELGAVVAGREGTWRSRDLRAPLALLEGPGGTLLVAGAGLRQSWLIRLRRDLRRDARFKIVKPRHLYIGGLARDRQERIVVAGVAYDDEFVNVRDDVGRAYLAVARLKG